MPFDALKLILGALTGAQALKGRIEGLDPDVPKPSGEVTMTNIPQQAEYISQRAARNVQPAAGIGPGMVPPRALGENAQDIYGRYLHREAVGKYLGSRLDPKDFEQALQTATKEVNERPSNFWNPKRVKDLTSDQALEKFMEAYLPNPGGFAKSQLDRARWYDSLDPLSYLKFTLRDPENNLYGAIPTDKELAALIRIGEANDPVIFERLGPGIKERISQWVEQQLGYGTHPTSPAPPPPHQIEAMKQKLASEVMKYEPEPNELYPKIPEHPHATTTKEDRIARRSQLLRDVYNKYMPREIRAKGYEDQLEWLERHPDIIKDREE